MLLSAISALKHMLGKESRLKEFGGGKGLHRCDPGATYLEECVTKKSTDHT